MALIKVEYTGKELAALIVRDLENKLNITMKVEDVKIMVKSKQNYKSEWEEASFKATYEGEA